VNAFTSTDVHSLARSRRPPASYLPDIPLPTPSAHPEAPSHHRLNEDAKGIRVRYVCYSRIDEDGWLPRWLIGFPVLAADANPS
jgi:hypothetical protein